VPRQKSLVPGGSGDPELDEALAARERAKEYGREYAALPEREGLPEAPTRHFDDEPQERWDCESVLSLRSNMENHPGKISEPRRAKPAAQGVHRGRRFVHTHTCGVSHNMRSAFPSHTLPCAPHDHHACGWHCTIVLDPPCEERRTTLIPKSVRVYHIT